MELMQVTAVCFHLFLILPSYSTRESRLSAAKVEDTLRSLQIRWKEEYQSLLSEDDFNNTCGNILHSSGCEEIETQGEGRAFMGILSEIENSNLGNKTVCEINRYAKVGKLGLVMLQQQIFKKTGFIIQWHNSNENIHDHCVERIRVYLSIIIMLAYLVMLSITNLGPKGISSEV